MTAQKSHEVMLGDRPCALTEVTVVELFDPAEVGLRLVPRCAACWRGSVCRYELQGEASIPGRLHVALKTMKGSHRLYVLHRLSTALGARHA